MSALTSLSTPPQAVTDVDTCYLQTLIGYNARRAALTVIGQFVREMACYDLRPVDFSILSVIHHNPGITQRQLSASLQIKPPNLVSKISGFEQRDWVERFAHPSDGRAVGLQLTLTGQALMKQAEATASELEVNASHKLTAAERATLLRLLQKIYA